MGMDSVELVLRIEDAFAIAIPGRVASGLTTPRNVLDFVMTQLKTSERPLPCLSQKAFHLLRRGFVRHLSLPRGQFRAGASLKELVPEGSRDEGWERIGKAVGAKKWPAMTLSFARPRVRSVRGLVDYLLVYEPRLVKGSESEWTRAQAWEVLTRVIVEETGVAEFSADSRFVEDLHID